MKFKLLITFLVAFLLAGGSALADEGGAKDTVDMILTVQPDSAAGILDIELELWVFDDADTLNGVSMGFGWDNPKIQMVDAQAESTLTASFTPPIFYDSDNIDSTNERQRFQLIGLRLFTPGVRPSPVKKHWATYFMAAGTDWTTSDVVHIDTFTYNSGTKYKFVSSTGGDYFPYWTGEVVITDVNPSLPKNIVLSEDTLFFSGVQGSSNPAPQYFVVSSDAEDFAFTLTEGASWLFKNPSSGTTPQTIEVSVNLLGLTDGTYFDSIMVASAAADNSPQFVYVELYVEPPPPTIGVSKTAFFFNAIAGEANPPDQYLTITNTGGSVLNWTLSKSETWLLLNMMSGSDSADITVSVDITGLPYGEYYDTITVSDPNATNDPVLIPVTLSVASDLPQIGVLPSDFNVIIVELSKLIQKDDYLVIEPRDLTIINASVGTMNFWIEETAERIDSVAPSSGTAPLTVEVAFSVPQDITYGDYFDTLWVYSNEAINSPYPVVFQFHIVYEAAILDVPDVVNINYYECLGGSLIDTPLTKRVISNTGGDSPMHAELTYESDYFSVNPTEGDELFMITITPSDLILSQPLGTYTDTIIVTALYAIGSPDTISVNMNIIPGDQPPELFVSDESPYRIPVKTGTAPYIEDDFIIWNLYGGCLEWQLTGTVPWAVPTHTSGQNPGHVNFLIDVSDYPFGEFLDTVIITSPGAVNSPLVVEMLLQVWLMRGDANFNGVVDIADIVHIIRYLYYDGVEIRPEYFIGDVDCSGVVDIADITYLINYLWQGGPAPCP
ncbi:MAG: BACON domain-containing protein [Candidatus Zixiibacteriota bacterium]